MHGGIQQFGYRCIVNLRMKKISISDNIQDF